MQYNYNAWVPSQSYYAFAEAAGCLTGYAVGSPAVSKTIFQCLVGKDTATLQNASASISASGMYGTWGFLPVTDGVFIRQTPSQQLQKKQVNGLRILSGVCFTSSLENLSLTVSEQRTRRATFRATEHNHRTRPCQFYSGDISPLH